MRTLLICVGVAVALTGTTMAIAGPKTQTATCATGFTAKPKTYIKGQTTGQSYTCTGPAAVCSPGFTLQQIAVPVPPPAGSTNALGTTKFVDGVSIIGGKMVYTCAEPPAPPK
jgi:hypothetical protein